MSVGVSPVQVALEQLEAVIRIKVNNQKENKKEETKRKNTTYCSASLRLRQTPTWLGCGILNVERGEEEKTLVSVKSEALQGVNNCNLVLLVFFS